jgi:xanthosine utilization system XapX-like protein
VDLETVKTVGMVAIVAIALIGLLLAIVIRKIVGKIISLVVAAALVFVAWQQRDKVTDYAAEVRGQACDSAAGAVENPTTREATSYLGIGISLPDGWCTP